MARPVWEQVAATVKACKSGPALAHRTQGEGLPHLKALPLMEFSTAGMSTRRLTGRRVCRMKTGQGHQGMRRALCPKVVPDHDSWAVAWGCTPV